MPLTSPWRCARWRGRPPRAPPASWAPPGRRSRPARRCAAPATWEAARAQPAPPPLASVPASTQPNRKVS
eukprot:9496140-Pyramimonas_sp.AAC.1